MTETKSTDVVLGEALTQLETLSQHMKDAARRVDEALTLFVGNREKLVELERRLEVVENKTHGLSIRPEQRICRHCGRILRGTGGKCTVCGKEQ
jgi:hypothetical protein